MLCLTCRNYPQPLPSSPTLTAPSPTCLTQDLKHLVHFECNWYSSSRDRDLLYSGLQEGLGHSCFLQKATKYQEHGSQMGPVPIIALYFKAL